MIAIADSPMDILYRDHSPRLLNYLVRLTLGDRRQAEDLLQETFVRAWQHLRKHPQTLESLKPWLYTVARRLVIDNIRARKSRPEEIGVNDLREVPAGTSNPIDGLMLRSQLRQAFQALRPEQRDVVVQMYFYGYCANEVAEQLGIPVGTVKSRAHYALRTLREAMDHGPQGARGV